MGSLDAICTALFATDDADSSLHSGFVERSAAGTSTSMGNGICGCWSVSDDGRATPLRAFQVSLANTKGLTCCALFLLEVWLLLLLLIKVFVGDDNLLSASAGVVSLFDVIAFVEREKHGRADVFALELDESLDDVQCCTDATLTTLSYFFALTEYMSACGANEPLATAN